MKKSTKIKTWAFFMRLGNRCGCHQREDRSFKVKGWQFPIWQPSKLHGRLYHHSGYVYAGSRIAHCCSIGQSQLVLPHCFRRSTFHCRRHCAAHIQKEKNGSRRFINIIYKAPTLANRGFSSSVGRSFHRHDALDLAHAVKHRGELGFIHDPDRCFKYSVAVLQKAA